MADTALIKRATDLGFVRVEKAKKGQGIMIALPIPDAIAKSMGKRRVPAEEMHVTLAYLGRTDKVTPDQVKKAMHICKEVAQRWPVMKAKIGGVGRFKASPSSDDMDVIYASFNSPDLPELRQEIVELMRADGVPFKNNHGFTPHITTDYFGPGDEASFPDTPDEEFDVPALRLHVGDEVFEMPFCQPETEEEAEELPEISDQDVAALKMMGIRLIAKGDDTDRVEVTVAGTNGEKRLVYGVVLEPLDIDAQDQVMTADDIEFAAHHFMAVQGIMGYRHRQTVPAKVVESYIAPCDFEMGGQLVKQGSWVLVSRCDDDKTWQEIADGTITGYSVGGWGQTRPLA